MTADTFIKKNVTLALHQHHILQSHFLNLVSPGDTRPAVQGIAVSDSQEARLVSGTSSWWRPVPFQWPPHPRPPLHGWAKPSLCMAGQDPLRLMFLVCFISLLKSLLLFYCMHFYLRFVRYPYVLALFFIPSLTVYRCYRILLVFLNFPCHSMLRDFIASLTLVFIFSEIL